MAPRLEVPTFSGPLSAQTITTHLNRCEDAFQLYEALGGDAVSPANRILVVGFKFDEPSVAQWWNDNRATLKALPTWSEFRGKVLARFVPVGWDTDALCAFYMLRQGTGDYTTFVSAVQSGKDAVGTGALKVSAQVHKNHLLFHAHEALMRRTMAIPGFDLGKITVDELVGLMSSTWLSLVADGTTSRTRSTRTSTIPSTSTMSQTHAPTTSSSSPVLSQAQRDALVDAGGCFRCGKNPSSPGWTPHRAINCPGDTSQGIRPGREFVKQEPVAAVHWSQSSDPEPNTSESEDENDEWHGD